MFNKNELMSLATEYKNRATTNKALADNELTAYVAHSHAKLEDQKGIFGRWRVPCLCSTIIGKRKIVVLFYM